MMEAKDKTARLLAAMWLRILPLVEERLVTLDQAAAAALAGALGQALQADAAGCAHKLAGSLGMYGFDEGTRVARELEVLLGDANPDASRLGGLIVELRSSLIPKN